jgi:hypothetical protein
MPVPAVAALAIGIRALSSTLSQEPASMSTLVTPKMVPLEKVPLQMVAQ